MFRQSLRFRLGLIIAMVAITMTTILLLVSVTFVSDFHSKSISIGQQQIRATVTELLSRDAEILAETLSNNLELPVYNQDLSAMQLTLQEFLARDDVNYIYVYDQQGRIIHDGSREINSYGQPVESKLSTPFTSDASIVLNREENRVYVNYPIQAGDVRFGGLSFSLSFSQAERQIKNHSRVLTEQSTGLMQQLLYGLGGGFLLLLVLVVPTSQWLSRRLLKPLAELTQSSRSYKEHGTGVCFRLPCNDELGELGEALHEMKEHIDNSNQKMEQMAFRDPLTGLTNRRGLYQELEKLLQWSSQHQQTLAVLFIDLDRFKQVNDSTSHEYGDLLLKEVAKRLQQLVRHRAGIAGISFPEETLLARLGGDEFVAILPQLQNANEAADFAERIRKSMQQPFQIKEHAFQLSSSTGISLFPDDARCTESIITHADIAMYHSKHSGRNSLHFFLPEMQLQVQQHTLIQQSIITAMQTNQLFMEYQPIFDLKTDQLTGAEALLRWHHPEQGVLNPDTFMPVIEHSNHIAQLTFWSIRRVCEDMELLCNSIEHFHLSLNISPAILHRKEVGRKIRDILLDSQIPNHFFCLEITETSVMENLEQSIELLSEWKNAGFKVWIDDFGTGYSSLSNLSMLPLDGVKIDKSFIQNSPQSQPVIKTILALTEIMQLKTIAEGIENQSQLNLLKQLGSNYGQGYLFSESLTIEQLESRVGSFQKV